MYAVEFEAINQNGMIKIPDDYHFANNEQLKVIILKQDDSNNLEFQKHKADVTNLINDYKNNGTQNFVDYKDGMQEIDTWLDGLNNWKL